MNLYYKIAFQLNVKSVIVHSKSSSIYAFTCVKFCIIHDVHTVYLCLFYSMSC